MSVYTLRWVALGGLMLGVLGIAVTVIAGGWAATGIGTAHSGTPVGVIGAMLTGWGVLLAAIAFLTSVFMHRR